MLLIPGYMLYKGSKHYLCKFLEYIEKRILLADKYLISNKCFLYIWISKTISDIDAYICERWLK